MKVFSILLSLSNFFTLTFFRFTKEENRLEISQFWLIFNWLKVAAISYFYIFNNQSNKGHLSTLGKVKMSTISSQFSSIIPATQIYGVLIIWLCFVMKRKLFVKLCNSSIKILRDLEVPIKVLRKEKWKLFLVVAIQNFSFTIMALTLHFIPPVRFKWDLILYFLPYNWIKNSLWIFYLVSQFFVVSLKALRAQLAKQFEAERKVLLSRETTKFQKQQACNEISTFIDKFVEIYENLTILNNLFNEFFNYTIIVVFYYQFSMGLQQVSTNHYRIECN